MVVVDYSIHDRSRPKDQDNDQRQQLFQDEDDSLDIALANFCPRLREAVTLLSRHRVGPLQKQVHLSDFQSSSTPSFLEDGLSSNTQPSRNDRFVLALPYMYDDMYALSGHYYMVHWSIISMCSRPDKAPEVILLGVDDSFIVSGFRETTVRQSQYSNSCSQNTQRRSLQTQERYWQQYVASDAFHLQCLTKWDKINNDKSSSLMQYCHLADQLYECYAHFQLYKLKMSLKSTPSMVQPPPQLIQAYTQYKQLIKLSKSSMAKVDTTKPEISVELMVDLDNDIIIKDCEDLRNQTSSALVCICAIISLVSYELTASALPLTSETTAHLSDEKITKHLASVTATFPHTVISRSACNKNSSNSSNTNTSLNNKYSVKILNSKLSHKEAMMTLMLDTITEQPFETTIIDFVTYVHRVQHAAFQAYNHEISSEEDRLSPIDNDNNSIKLLLQSLHEIFCDSPSNGNSLLDYQISEQDSTVEMTTNFIRFLLVDGDLATETSQLKFILSIEFSKEVFKEFESTSTMEDSIQSKNLVPVVTLRSVYDDENSEHYLNIDVDNILTEADNQKYSNELAYIIKTAAVNGMQQLRDEVITLVLNCCNKQ